MFWERAVREFEASELTHREFARKKGVGIGTLRSWIYRLRRETGGSPSPGASVRIVPVTVRPASVASGEWLELAVGEVVLRFCAGTDAAYIAELASKLGSVRC